MWPLGSSLTPLVIGLDLGLGLVFLGWSSVESLGLGGRLGLGLGLAGETPAAGGADPGDVLVVERLLVPRRAISLKILAAPSSMYRRSSSWLARERLFEGAEPPDVVAMGEELPAAIACKKKKKMN